MTRAIVESIKKRFHELDPCTNSNYSNYTNLRAPLRIPINPNESEIEVEISFTTTDKCTAIQFIQGDTGPYVFSQCEAIHARSLFPCFDTPAVKSPYKFTGHSPAVVTMSGRAQPTDEPNTYHFDQPIPIPSYLVSITSGNLLKAPIGPRSDVYSEEPSLKKCQWEFEKDMENFIQIAEKIVFEYEWSRFDSLVLPSSFPYGGMEIPNMTQLTPTLISGDRTQTKVMAHELAHSWSGNLVTNSSWEHFWLNEGWTVYLERRIIGAIAAAEAKEEGRKDAEKYGEQVRHFNMINGWNELADTCETFDKRYTKLVLDLENGDPDDSFSRIPYEKGFFFLYHLETKLGGIKEFDPFIKYYFNKFKYQSLNTAQFVDTLYEFYEPKGKAEILDNIDWETWLFVSGLPEKPEFDVTLANQVYALVDKWVAYVKNGGELPGDETADFEGEQDMLFLETLTEKFKTLDVKPEIIRLFPEIYPKYGASKNGEIISRWNELLISYVFIKVLSWFQLNHGNLSVLIHPQTGDDVKDHTSSALWLGEKLPLLLNVFGEPDGKIPEFGVARGKGFHSKTLTITKQPFKDAIVNVSTTANVS
ncbi:Peptidase M1 family protein [Candida albicans]|uniref:soluble epoxide hydrolase n=1 Tax=Candida albicans TaxID=5476 RepID=A0A8H6BUI9_CANAX|nr:Peptidase M1 family protein [Candida albicans]